MGVRSASGWPRSAAPAEPHRRRDPRRTGSGRACVARLPGDGFDVVLGYASNADEADAAASRSPSLHRPSSRRRRDRDGRTVRPSRTQILRSRPRRECSRRPGSGPSSISTSPASPTCTAPTSAPRSPSSQQRACRLRPGGSIFSFSTSVVSTFFLSYGAHIASTSAALSMNPRRGPRGRDARPMSSLPVRLRLICSSTARTTRRQLISSIATELCRRPAYLGMRFWWSAVWLCAKLLLRGWTAGLTGPERRRPGSTRRNRLTRMRPACWAGSSYSGW